jgi:hypothetical protein
MAPFGRIHDGGDGRRTAGEFAGADHALHYGVREDLSATRPDVSVARYASSWHENWQVSDVCKIRKLAESLVLVCPEPRRRNFRKQFHQVGFVKTLAPVDG